MKLILIRHPETIANEKGLMYGKSDYEYSNDGIKMFEDILLLIGQRKISSFEVYSSPRGRAKKLALEIAKVANSNVIVSEVIREMEFGIFENLTPDQALEKYPDLYNQFMNNYSEFTIPEGESFMKVYHRAEAFFTEIIKQNKDCIIVSHGMFIKAAISFLLGFKLEESWHFITKPGAIVEINHENNYGVLLEFKNFE